MKCGRIMYPADFWTLRPLFWPEISVGAKFCSFLALCDLPPPFIFAKNDEIQNFLFFLLKVCEWLLQSGISIMVLLFTTSKNLQMTTAVMPKILIPDCNNHLHTLSKIKKKI